MTRGERGGGENEGGERGKGLKRRYKNNERQRTGQIKAHDTGAEQRCARSRVFSFEPAVPLCISVLRSHPLFGLGEEERNEEERRERGRFSPLLRNC